MITWVVIGVATRGLSCHLNISWRYKTSNSRRNFFPSKCVLGYSVHWSRHIRDCDGAPRLHCFSVGAMAKLLHFAHRYLSCCTPQLVERVIIARCSPETASLSFLRITHTPYTRGFPEVENVLSEGTCFMTIMALLHYSCCKASYSPR